jgi:alcohol dehydrogenase (cytochrome c)
VNGKVYLVMNDLHIVAIRATDGAVLWNYQPSINRTGLPLGTLVGHVHGLTYWKGMIWVSLPDCSALSLDAISGTPIKHITRICENIPGNSGKYSYSGAPLTFDGDVMFWTASSVSEGTNAGRGFVAAYDSVTGALLWRWYIAPPEGGDPNWDSETCARPCHGNVKPYTWDWGTLGETNGETRAGAGPSWGQAAVDSKDGLLFLGTSQPSPDWNATYRPGPNLYSDSIIALNITNGYLVWFYQTTPHDLYDFDCGWNVALGSIVRSGSNETIVYKSCKNGFVYALGAKSGNLLWSFNPPSVTRANTANSEYSQSGIYNPLEPWMSTRNGTVEQCPGINGGIESDISVAYGKVFVATHNFCTFVTLGPVEKIGGLVTGSSRVTYDSRNANTTVYAIDQATGHEAWSYFLPQVPYRGWLTTTGGLVFISTLDGRILALEVNTGRLVGDTSVGSPLYEGVTIGSDLAGRTMIFQLTSASAYGGFVAPSPGALLAFGPGRVSPSSNWLVSLVLVAAGTIGAIIVLKFTWVRRSKS